MPDQLRIVSIGATPLTFLINLRVLWLIMHSVVIGLDV